MDSILNSILKEEREDGTKIITDNRTQIIFYLFPLKCNLGICFNTESVLQNMQELSNDYKAKLFDFSPYGAK